MSGLNLAERHEAATADALAPAIWSGISESDVELKHLVEFVSVLLLVLDRLLCLYLGGIEDGFLLWLWVSLGAEGCLPA